MRESGPKVQSGGLDSLDLMISTTHCALCGGVSGSLCFRKETEKKEEGKGKIRHFTCRCPFVDPLTGIILSQCQALLFSNEISRMGTKTGYLRKVMQKDVMKIYIFIF